jgi:hypothetical protein
MKIIYTYIKSHYVTRIVQDVQDADGCRQGEHPESVCLQGEHPESVCLPKSNFVFQYHLGWFMLVAFFFAAGNFSCLHLIARSLKVQGVSWSAVHVVKIGN